jgi:hypothetical protein
MIEERSLIHLRVCRAVFDLRAHFWSMAICVAIVGCAPGEGSLVPGKVTLEYVGISDSEMTVTLANGLDRAIYVRGYRNLSLTISVWPGETEIVCAPDPGRRESAGFGIYEGRQPGFSKVSANTRVKLVIPTSFPQQYKGKECRFELMLKDGTTVGPIEFHP